ncbi:MAG TPA: hypothetical protein VF459_10830 [Caulobacteraceae bacterium]
MSSFLRGGAALAVVLLAGAIAAPAQAAHGPDARIRFHGGSFAFLAGVNWGDGSLTYKGHNYRIKVGGLSVGAVGANKYSGSGEVYHLRRLRDIEGTYTAIDASMTAGAGAGEVDMKNGNGVEIHIHSSSAGLKLSFAPSGVSIKLK